MRQTAPSSKPARRLSADRSVIRIGLLGLGTVGTGVAEILQRHQQLISERAGASVQIIRALVKSQRRRTGAAAGISLTRSPEALVEADDIDIVCELIGGEEPALDLVRRALLAGKPVVTANKTIVAQHGRKLFAAAKRGQSDIYFEAAVAGGIPIIRTLREGLASDRITSVLGILNGTTNYILGAMDKGASYRDALRNAQKLGFAEADPTRDVMGLDAADKLSILLNLAYGLTVRRGKLQTEGIAELTPDVMEDARSLGYRVKLLATARRVGDNGAIAAGVGPAFVPDGHPLSTVPGAQNAIAVVSDALGPTLYQGAGAGGLPTGSAVVSDIIEAARSLRSGISGRVPGGKNDAAVSLLAAERAVGCYYLRLLVQDEPGVLAAVTKVLGDRGVSLATVLQRERAKRKGEAVPIVLTTHETSTGAVRKAMQALHRLRVVSDKIQVVKIEGEHAES